MHTLAHKGDGNTLSRQACSLHSDERPYPPHLPTVIGIALSYQGVGHLCKGVCIP